MTHKTDTNNLSQYDLAYALPGAFASLSSGGSWKYARHLRLIEDELVQVLNNPIRLLISTPPRVGKSELISKHFIPWYLGHFPDKKAMLLTYQQTFSEEISQGARETFKEFGPDVFGTGLNPNAKKVSAWQTTEGGVCHAIGLGGSVAGRGADLLVIDDFIKGAEEALSPHILEQKINFFWADVYSRLSPTASLVVVSTRWAEEDLIGVLKDRMEDPNASEYVEKFKEIRIPALCDDPDNDPLGREMDEPIDDDPEWPYYRGYEGWMKIKSNTPAAWWESLYMARPAPRSGNLINIDWFAYYDNVPDDPDMIVISWDTAQKATELSDYTVAGVHYMKDGKYYLVDFHRDRMEHPRLLQLFNQLEERWCPHATVIEDKGSGTSLIQYAESESIGNIVPMSPSTSKEIRADSESVAIQSGRYVLPNPHQMSVPWVSDFLSEFRMFPRSPHDDIVDMVSQFLKFARERNDLEEFDVW